jgi:hypothetical protein
MIKRKAFKLILGVLLCAQMAFTSGCTLLLLTGAAAGAIAGTAFYMGKLTGTVDGTSEQVQVAVLRAFNDEKITKSNIVSIPNSITIIGGDFETGVRVVITPEGKDKSKVAIRFGTFGDQAKSNQLYNKIVQNLAK